MEKRPSCQGLPVALPYVLFPSHNVIDVATLSFLILLKLFTHIMLSWNNGA